MSVNEIEAAVTRLSAEDLSKFADWFAEYHAKAWDERIERDLDAGRLNHLLRQVDEAYEAGKAEPL